MSNPVFSSICRSVLLVVLILSLSPLSESAAHTGSLTKSPEVATVDAPLPGGRLMAVGLDRFKNWNRVRHFFLDPQNYRHSELRSWVTWAQTLRRLPVYERLAAINARVGARIAYAADEIVWHRADYWEDPLEVVRKGRTDCEGYVVLKMFLAIAAGIDREQMAIVVGRVPDLGIFHAVLIVRVGVARYVLDNLRPQMNEVSASMDFEPMYAVDTVSAWSFPSSPTPAGAWIVAAP